MLYSMALAQTKLDSSGLETTVQLHQEKGFQSPPSPPLLQGDTDTTPGMEEIDYESLPTDKLSIHLCAGAAAGTLEHCAMYPVDCVKTRMMTLNPDPNASYKNLPQAFSRILTKESPRVLFRGIGVVASGAGPAHAIYFACYEFTKKSLSTRDRSTVLSQGGAGAISSVLHDGFMNPIDAVKQRLQMYNSPYKGAFDCIKTVFRSEGLRAFYRSYTTQLSMNVPFQMTHFISYEFLQDRMNYERNYNPISHMLSGAGAGAIASAVTNPLDVAKTLLNTRAQSRDNVASERRLVGMTSAIFEIYRCNGVRGYLKGLTARVTYQIPSTALCWSVYEFFKHFLGMKYKDDNCATTYTPPS